MLKKISVAVQIFLLVAPLTACESLLRNISLNAPDKQLALVAEADIVDQEEFAINMPQFLARQLRDLDEAMAAQGYERNPDFARSAARFCDIGEDAVHRMADVASASRTLRSSAFLDNDVMQAVIATAATGHLGPLSGSRIETKFAPFELRYADFEEFRRLISDAVNASVSTLDLQGVDREAPDMTFASILVPRSRDLEEVDDAPLLAYLGAYYNGAFVDRFGNVLEKPAFENGVEDGTIANFVQVIVELAADLPAPRLAALVDGKDPPTFYPGQGEEPTFHKVFKEQKVVAEQGDAGISVLETKLIATGANFIADQGLTLFSGFLEALSEFHIGFVVAGNFAIGSNDTLMTVARVVIETALRRGAERGMHCLTEKYDLDAVAEIIDRVTE